MPDYVNGSLAWPSLVTAFVIGYLFGTIPFGVILTRFAGLGDIRKVGSGNIGATNVLRTGRKGLAAATLVGDALKGTVPTLLMGSLWGPDAAILAAVGAFLGHLFPVWLGFKGGKGVATFIGGLIALSPVTALVFAVVWLVLAFVARYSSLAALAASAASPITLWLMGRHRAAEAFVLVVIILWWKHRENIKRLAAGTESRIGQKG